MRNLAITSGAVSRDGNEAAVRGTGDSASAALVGSGARSPNSVAGAQYQDAVNQSNEALAQSGVTMEFVVDQTIHRVIVKIIDTQTNEVLQQVPTESMLVIARALANPPAKGVLVDSLA